MYVCVRMWWESDEKGKQAKATLERKDWGKAEGARWQTDDKRDVWWRLISPITDIHPGKKQRWTNAKQRVQQQQQRDGRVGEVDTCIQTQGMTRYAPLFPEPSYPEVIPATTARNFPLCILWQSYSSPSLVKSHLWLMATVGSVWAKRFFSLFFPSRVWVRVNEAFYMLLCRGLRYMFDVSRFVRD